MVRESEKMTLDPIKVWTIITCLAAGTYFIRWSFLGLLGDRELPEWAHRHLRYTAVAILPGLIAPFVLFPTITGGQTDPIRLAAALAALCLGVWYKSAMAAILGGFGVLYTLQYLIAG
jgi:branched-subunit amino acid transport protein